MPVAGASHSRYAVNAGHWSFIVKFLNDSEAPYRTCGFRPCDSKIQTGQRWPFRAAHTIPHKHAPAWAQDWLLGPLRGRRHIPFPCLAFSARMGGSDDGLISMTYCFYFFPKTLAMSQIAGERFPGGFLLSLKQKTKKTNLWRE